MALVMFATLDFNVAPVVNQPLNLRSIRHRNELVLRDNLSLIDGTTALLRSHVDHWHFSPPYCLRRSYLYLHGSHGFGSTQIMSGQQPSGAHSIVLIVNSTP